MSTQAQTSKKVVPVKTNEEKAVEFVPFGCTDKIRLTASMVRQFIAVPTRSGALPSERDCIRFIMLCRGKRANPFEGDCFLIGYDSQGGASFSMVCGLELFLKRAEQNDQYDGNKSGITVLTSDNQLIDRKGCILLKNETLVGGWCEVKRKDRSEPFYKTAALEVYNTGRSRWQKDPAGMIEKVAKSQALREAFPTALGGFYTQEEMEKVTEMGGSVIDDRKPITMPKAIGGSKAVHHPDSSEETGQDDLDDHVSEEAFARNETKPATAQEQLDAEMEARGVSFDDFRDFIGPKNKNLYADADSLTSFNEVPEAVCQTLAGVPKLMAELVKKFGQTVKKP